jgi:capsid assembly protease
MHLDPTEPYALLPTVAASFVKEATAPSARSSGESIPDPYLVDREGQKLAAESTQASGGAIAIVPLWGTLSPDGRYWGTATDDFARTMKRLAAAGNVAGIIVNVTSPGGTVTGTMEAADTVRSLRDSKPIVAVANGQMASAATWIGTAAGQVVITPSGEGGSIGVISMYADLSKFYESMGIKVDVLRVPDKKARFSGVEPMTDEMRETMTTRLGEAYQKFLRAMASNRGIRIDQVEKKFGGGEMLSAEEALSAGLVDKIATLDDTIAAMVKQTTRRAPASARAQLALAELG